MHRLARSHALSPALAVLLLLAGCAGKVHTVHQTEGFDPADLKVGSVAIGGLVLSQRLDADPVSKVPNGAPEDLHGQADLWSPVLYEKFLAYGGGTVIWPWPSTFDAMGDTIGGEVLRTAARGGVIVPDRLAKIAAALDGVRFLAVARVDGNEVSLLEASPTTSQMEQASRDPHDTQQRTWSKTRRKVTVTLDIYDLETHRSVWSSTADRRRDHLLSGDDQMLVEEEMPREPGDPLIDSRSAHLPASPFDKVLGDACAAAVERLFDIKNNS